MDVFEKNRAFFYAVAKANTRKNIYGQTTISREDPDFYDDDWDKVYKESLNARYQEERSMVR